MAIAAVAMVAAQVVAKQWWMAAVAAAVAGAVVAAAVAVAVTLAEV